MPLAPLAQVTQPELPGVIRRMKERLGAEVRPAEEATLWTATYVLMGLCYDEALTAELLKGVRDMEESVTYQAIVRKGMAEGMAKGMAKGMAEGRAEEAQRILLRVGRKALGEPDEATKAAIAVLADPERLEALIDRLGEVKSWKELLAKPRFGRRNGGKRKS